MVAVNPPAVSEADRTLILTRMLNAPRAPVFKVWTQPEHLVKWMGPAGFTLPFCEMDFRAGGTYRFCMRSPEGTDYWVAGIYREIVEPERIVFTWGRPEFPAETVVTVTLVEEGGQTKLTLHHALFETADHRDQHRGGWSECLERLADYASAQNPSPHSRGD